MGDLFRGSPITERQRRMVTVGGKTHRRGYNGHDSATSDFVTQNPLQKQASSARYNRLETDLRRRSLLNAFDSQVLFKCSLTRPKKEDFLNVLFTTFFNIGKEKISSCRKLASPLTVIGTLIASDRQQHTISAQRHKDHEALTTL